MKKRIVSLLIAVTMLLPFMSVVSAAETGDAEWTYEMFTYDGKDGVAVTGYSGSDTDVFVPANIDISENGETVSYPVLKVGDNTFKNNTKINSVTLSENVKAIGDSAFEGAENMVCIVTNEGLAEIGANAFKGCVSFNSLILESGVNAIGENAFLSCDLLMTYVYNDSYAHKYMQQNNLNFTLIDPNSQGTVIEQDGITYLLINGYVYIQLCNPDKEGEVALPATMNGYPVVEVFNNAFESCEKITKIILPDTIKKIDSGAFAGCGMKDIIFSKGLTEIGEGAFYGCDGLQEIQLPDTVVYIGKKAFASCSNLSIVNIPSSMTHMPDSVFAGCPIEELTIPDNITVIDDYAFNGYDSLKEIKLPKNLVEIGEYAFSGTQITKIILPESLKKIHLSAFDNNSLKELVIPAGVTDIGYDGKLYSLTILGVYEDSYAKKFAEDNNIPYFIATSPDDVSNIEYEKDGVTYLTANGEAKVISCDKTKTEINILPTIEGRTVTEIAEYAFMGGAITKIILPYSLKKIHLNAFKDCSGLSKFVVPYGVNSIEYDGSLYSLTMLGVYEGSYAKKFAEDNNIPYFIATAPDDVPNIEKDGITYRIINGEAKVISCDKTKTEITIPSTIEGYTVTEIAEYAFMGGAITKIILPEGLKKIYLNAFKDCSGLTEFVIPSSVNSIERESFSLYSLTILGVYEGSYAKKFAEDNNIPYFIATAPDDVSSMTIREKDGITYRTANGEAKVISCDGKKTEVIIPSTIDNCTVTEIAEHVFVDGFGARKITLPDTIVKIDKRAFENSHGLKDINLPQGLQSIGYYAFYGCSSLTNIVIPDSVTEIGTGAFYKCSSLTNITIPDSIKEISEEAFCGCSNLATVTMSDGVTQIGSGAFAACSSLTNIVIPNSVTEIGEGTFYNCDSLANITIPDSIKEIGSSVFAGCSNLTTVIIPDGVTKIGSGAFDECSSLTNIVIPDSVTEIGDYAFRSCSNLTTIKIPSGMQFVDFSAFSGCAALETIIFPQSVKQIDNVYDWSNASSVLWCVYADSAALETAEQNDFIKYVIITSDDLPEIYNVDGIKYYTLDGNATVISCASEQEGEITIPSEIEGCPVTSIGNNAFKDQNNITKITLPDTVEKIGANAFSCCCMIEEIRLSDNLTEIGKYAFRECHKLNNITIPHKVSRIEEGLFIGCDNLAEANIQEGVKYINIGAFSDCRNLDILPIPASVTDLEGCLNKKTILCVYKDSNAKAFAENNDIIYIERDISDSIPEIYTEDGITYCISKGKAKVAFIREETPDVIIPQTVKQCPVTGIINRAFERTWIESITIPDSVIEIEECAFQDCFGLANVTIQGSVNQIGDSAFRGCMALENVTIHSDVAKIGDYAFNGCSNLTTLTISEGAIEVGNHAFDGCSSLIALRMSDKAVKIGDYAFSECSSLTDITIPDSITRIGSYAFSGCSNLTDITIPGSVIEVGKFAFNECNKLDKVYITDFEAWCNIDFYNYYSNPLYYADNLYLNNEQVSDIVIPDGVIKIGDYAFNGCGCLTSVVISDSVTGIGYHAFDGCSNLEKITIPESVIEINHYAFNKCSSLTDITIPDGVKEIGDGTFSGCSRLKEIRLSEGLFRISNSAFADCTELETVNIPSTVKQILGSGIFSGCTKITSVELPEGLTAVSLAAFDGLATVTIPKSVEWIEGGYLSNTLVCVYENSYAHTYLDEKANEYNISYIVIPNGSDVTVVDSQRVSGTVTSVTGASKPDVSVDLLDKNGKTVANSTTNSDGVYTFPDVKVGTYILRAKDSDGNIGTDSISVKRKSLFEVYLTGNTYVTIQDNASVKGTVTDENSNALLDIKMSLIDDTGVVFATGKTGINGEYEFSNVPNGTYLLRGEDSAGGAVVQEITVFAPNGNTIADLEILQGSAIAGKIIDDKNNVQSNAEVIITNSTGERVALLYTDENGKYTAGNLPAGTYHINAVSENGDGDLSGEGYFIIEKAGNIQVDDIVIKAKITATASISGKVTAHGQVQVSSVMLRDIFMNEIAVCNTTNNGKYNFLNVPDGTYTIVATTTAEGAGFTTVTIKDGELVSGNTSITVYKTGTVEDLEIQIDLLPSADSGANTISASKNAITKAKTAYDSLSNKDKKRVSQDKVDKLHTLISIIMSENLVVETENDIKVSGLETVWSSDDIAGSTDSQVVLNVTENSGITAFAEDTTSDNQFDNQRITQKAEDEGKTIIKSYDVSLEKTTDSSTKQIRNIKKDSVGMGSVTITMAIPEQYRGHKNYSVIHMHNGQIYTLADIDNNDNTVTVESDKFSDFVLTFDDNNNSHQGLDKDITYDAASKTATIHSMIDTTADVIFASYYQGRLINVTIKENQSIVIGDNPITAEDLNVSSSDEVKVMVWDSLKNIKPIFDMCSSEI